MKERRKYNTTRGREIFEIGKFSRARASLGRKNLKSEKNSALENNFSTVAEGENFREAKSEKANFFPEVDFVCVCAPVAIISRAVWKLRNGLRLRGNFEIGKEQFTRAFCDHQQGGKWKLRNGLRLRGNFEIGKEKCTRK